MKHILSLIFGHTYYAVIIHTRGTEKFEIASEIHRDKQSANEHVKRIAATLSFDAVEIVRFRSRKDY